jgi:hypothetical protein
MIYPNNFAIKMEFLPGKARRSFKNPAKPHLSVIINVFYLIFSNIAYKITL